MRNQSFHSLRQPLGLLQGRSPYLASSANCALRLAHAGIAYDSAESVPGGNHEEEKETIESGIQVEVLGDSTSVLHPGEELASNHGEEEGIHLKVRKFQA
jgi:hypothetical protein